MVLCMAGLSMQAQSQLVVKTTGGSTEKFALDVWYVDHCTFKTDLKVIFTTINKVLRRADISHDGSVTMEVFNGNN